MYRPEGRSNSRDTLTWCGSKVAVILVIRVKLKMENINSWSDIDWPEVNKRVYRLQLRIYNASRNNERDKMHKLQKLLIKGDSAKLLAVRKVAQENAGKATPGVDEVKDLTAIERLLMAKSICIDGQSSSIRRVEIPKQDGSSRYLGIPTMKDRAKQALALLALNPEWEAKFEPQSYGFRPGRSVNDAMEAIFLSISKKPKWVLDADIEKCFDKIDHKKLIEKCDTFPPMEKQIKAWLKAGVLEGKDYAFPEMGTPQGGVISPLLSNIALHGLTDILHTYASTLGGDKSKRDNIRSLSYVRYADDLVILHPDIEVIQHSKVLISDFLGEMGLRLSPSKTKIAHTFEKHEEYQLGFEFLGFDVIQRAKYAQMRRATVKNTSDQQFITLITPSKKGTEHHKQKLREVIKKYRGISQENLIYILNPIIRGWALSKRTQISSKIFAELDKFVYINLWKWAVKRHPKLPKVQLKNKYWHTEGKSNWVFGIKGKEMNLEPSKVVLRLQKHSEVKIQRHVKVKGNASPYDGNVLYWAERTGQHTLLPPIKAKLVKDQKGICAICKQAFLPGDTIERDHITPKALGGKNIRENVQAIHDYCHRTKTRTDILKMRRHKKDEALSQVASPPGAE